jgi:hypothetical protein
LSWTKLPLSISFLKAAWIISGDGEWGRIALGAIYTIQGPQTATACAADWMARRPSPPLAALAGLWAIEAGNFDGAAAYLRHGRDLGNDRNGLLDLLDLLVSLHQSTAQETMEVANRLLKRRDLSPLVSKRIQTSACWTVFCEGRFDEAATEARRLLEIEPNVHAEMVLWAVAKARGQRAAAEAHLAAAAATDTPAPLRKYLEACGNAAIGCFGEARDAVAPLRQERPDLAQRLESYLSQREAAS